MKGARPARVFAIVAAALLTQTPGAMKDVPQKGSKWSTLGKAFSPRPPLKSEKWIDARSRIKGQLLGSIESTTDPSDTNWWTWTQKDTGEFLYRTIGKKAGVAPGFAAEAATKQAMVSPQALRALTKNKAYCWRYACAQGLGVPFNIFNQMMHHLDTIDGGKWKDLHLDIAASVAMGPTDGPMQSTGQDSALFLAKLKMAPLAALKIHGNPDTSKLLKERIRCSKFQPKVLRKREADADLQPWLDETMKELTEATTAWLKEKPLQRRVLMGGGDEGSGHAWVVLDYKGKLYYADANGKGRDGELQEPWDFFRNDAEKAQFNYLSWILADWHPDCPSGDLLLHAAWYGDAAKVKRLIDAGAEIDLRQKGDHGATPLWGAAWRGHAEVAGELIAAGANVNLATIKNGFTPLYAAAAQGFGGVVQVLVRAKADLNKAGAWDGDTPLYVATEHGHIEVVRLLLEAGADVNKAALFGNRFTPLHVAASKGNKAIAEVLLEHGANPVIESTEGKTARHTAELMGHDWGDAFWEK